MKKRILLLILACLIAVGVFFGRRIRRGIIYYRAESLVANERFEEAKSWYAMVEDTEKMQDCDDLRLGDTYDDAVSLMEEGGYDEAKAVFADMDGYKNTRLLVKECDYLKGEKLAREKNYSEAIAVFRTLKGYKDVSKKIEAAQEHIYQNALNMTYSFDLQSALPLYEELGDYKDSGYLLNRCERILDMQADRSLEPLLTEEKIFGNYENVTVYNDKTGYLIIPKECNSETRFFVYFPGGRNTEVSVDFLTNYIMGAAPNTIALFLHTNGINDTMAKTEELIDTLDQAAMECGVFAHDILFCGSSLGAYPAMRSVVYCYEYYGISIGCALLLDAGNDWTAQEILTNRESQVAAAAGTEFYLFEDGGVGIYTEPINLMLKNGNKITLVLCVNDDHERITFDALGLGVIDWALGERAQPFDMDIYRFQTLELK